MLKIIKKAVATVAVLLLLFACDGTKEITISPKISALLTIKNNDITIRGEFTRQIDGTMEYLILEPPEISGMRYVFSENMFTLYYHDMERSGDIWQDSPVKIVFNAINAMVGIPIKNKEIMTEHGKCTYQIEKENIKEIRISNIVATFEY